MLGLPFLAAIMLGAMEAEDEEDFEEEEVENWYDEDSECEYYDE